MPFESVCARPGPITSLCLLGTLLFLSETLAATEFLTPSVSVTELQSMRLGESPPLIIDLRSPSEYRVGHIPGARNIAPDDLVNRLEEIGAARQTVLYCIVGKRTREAEQILIEHRVPDLRHLDGGFGSWIRSGLEIEKP